MLLTKYFQEPHSVTSLSAVGPRTTSGERVNGAVAGDSGQTRVQPVRNVVAATVPSRPSAASVSSAAAQPAVSVPPQSPESVPLSAIVADANSQRNYMQTENQASLGVYYIIKCSELCFVLVVLIRK